MRKLWNGVKAAGRFVWNYIKETVKLSWDVLKEGSISFWHNLKENMIEIRLTWSESKVRAIFGTLLRIPAWILSPIALLVWTVAILAMGLIVTPIIILGILASIGIIGAVFFTIPLIIWCFEWLSDKVLGFEASGIRTAQLFEDYKEEAIA